MDEKEGLFVFSAEEELVNTDLKVWKILTVEDDLDYQHALVNSLKALKAKEGYKYELLAANSVPEAALALSMHPDIALVFIDVVMEEDDSGLRLVNTIREVIGNAEMRIVLLTGQPGFAPETDVMKMLDIDEYWNKSDISAQKLESIVNSNMRTWQYISQITAAKQGLQLVLDASRSINSKHDMGSYSAAVLQELSNILKISEGGGILCSSNLDKGDNAMILTTNGCFNGMKGQKVDSNLLADMYDDFQLAIQEKRHVFSNQHSIFFFPATIAEGTHYITLVKSDNPISEENEYLLKVFSENVSSGFANISLLNRLTELAYTDVSLNLQNRNWLTREIKNMNVYEKSKMRLIIFDIYQFDEKAFTFGYDFCKKIIKLVHKSIVDVFSIYDPRIAIISNSSFGMLINVDFDITDDIARFHNKQKYEIENVKQFIDVRVLELKLSCASNITPEKVISLAESSLNYMQVTQAKFILHTDEKTVAITRRYELMARLRTAISTKELRVALQPKMCLKTLKPIGFEALARWQLADGSFVNPEEFIELAETAGLINELDNVIFEKILQIINQLKSCGINLPIAFNASSYDLIEPSYFESIKSRIEEYKVSPSMLELEVTETQAISNYNFIKEALSRFMALGIKVSIDDFGTGYSSLAHINEIPSNAIKIDRYFVSNLEHNINNQYMIKMIISLAKQFDFKVIAEGVENEFEVQWLKQAGCEMAQGYFFAKPLFYDDLLIWLTQFDNVND
ncbi:EAL domain-containing response regulator [Pseudoalteromonas rhizosphaerae]|uniref:EAL domain-containing response regulator n=1 Tax=Pseudoalteromonas rhizosphaerae TaxID=2518973 RepID=UPI001230C331|nr:EAL domain-containing protein [Pseudoalteromonas rhizosphaerae]